MESKGSRYNGRTKQRARKSGKLYASKGLSAGQRAVLTTVTKVSEKRLSLTKALVDIISFSDTQRYSNDDEEWFEVQTCGKKASQNFSVDGTRLVKVPRSAFVVEVDILGKHFELPLHCTAIRDVYEKSGECVMLSIMPGFA